MNKLFLHLLSAVCFLWGGVAHATAPGPSELFDMAAIRDETTLDTQITSDHVRPSKARPGKSVRVIELKFTSQNWHGMVWRHPARIYVPKGYQGGGNAGIFATARRFFDDASDPQHTIPGTGQNTEEQYAEATAIDLNLPIMVFSNPPEDFQGLDENDLMGFALKKAVETGDLTWYGYAPITTGYLRAITLMHSLAGVKADRAVIMGCSKRGVAVSLATGVDPDRVAGIMAACYTGGNTLYGAAQQFAEFGPSVRGPADNRTGPGHQSAEDLLRSLNNPFGLEIIKRFDPYIWRSQIKAKYFVVLGTNDQFFALGAANSMMKEMPSEKAYLAIDNVNHTWVSPKHLAAWRMWLAHTFLNRPIAKVDAKATVESDQLRVSATLVTATSPVAAKLYYSYNKFNLDWRAAKWQSVPMVNASGTWTASLPLKDGQNLAYYVEVEETGAGGAGFVSSLVEIHE
jgi:PhoPQ-activated pathogenicity-related protein